VQQVRSRVKIGMKRESVWMLTFSQLRAGAADGQALVRISGR